MHHCASANMFGPRDKRPVWCLMLLLVSQAYKWISYIPAGDGPANLEWKIMSTNESLWLFLSGNHYNITWCILDADTSYHTDHPFSWTLRVSSIFQVHSHHFLISITVALSVNCKATASIFTLHHSSNSCFVFPNCFHSPDRLSLLCDSKLTEDGRSCGT